MLTEDCSPELCEADEIADHEKNYYCQRCLNHGEYNPRKGHKPDCGYLKCPCDDCNMVERRRQLNSLLSRKKAQITPSTMTPNGKRVRDPHCARCSAHGVLVPLRGHKKTMCQFSTCECTLCKLVESRRSLMAAQIKLRRTQQKTRDGNEPRVRKNSRKVKEAVTVITEDHGKRGGTSTSPSPACTIDTMSPDLSLSAPSSPLGSSQTLQFPILPSLPTALPIPAPQPLTPLQQILLINYLQNLQNPVMPLPSPLLGAFYNICLPDSGLKI